jgi:hypothetical protein
LILPLECYARAARTAATLRSGRFGVADPGTLGCGIWCASIPPTSPRRCGWKPRPTGGSSGTSSGKDLWPTAPPTCSAATARAGRRSARFRAWWRAVPPSGVPVGAVLPRPAAHPGPERARPAADLVRRLSAAPRRSGWRSSCRSTASPRASTSCRTARGSCTTHLAVRARRAAADLRGPATSAIGLVRPAAPGAAAHRGGAEADRTGAATTVGVASRQAARPDYPCAGGDGHGRRRARDDPGQRDRRPGARARRPVGRCADGDLSSSCGPGGRRSRRYRVAGRSARRAARRCARPAAAGGHVRPPGWR